jgi:hypothetical protein
VSVTIKFYQMSSKIPTRQRSEVKPTAIVSPKESARKPTPLKDHLSLAERASASYAEALLKHQPVPRQQRKSTGNPGRPTTPRLRRQSTATAVTRVSPRVNKGQRISLAMPTATITSPNIGSRNSQRRARVLNST